MASSTADAFNAMGRQVAMINLRSDYVRGRIDVEEFEESVDRLLRGRSAAPVERPIDRGRGGYGTLQIIHR